MKEDQKSREKDKERLINKPKVQDGKVRAEAETPTKEDNLSLEQRHTLTTFGAETNFNGTLEFTDNLLILGHFTGKIDATGNLEIARGAVCNVESIRASSIIVSGEVIGNLEGTSKVEICSGGKVTGDINTPRIRIEDDSEFSGSLNMLPSVPVGDIFESSSKEFKAAFVTHTQTIR